MLKKALSSLCAAVLLLSCLLPAGLINAENTPLTITGDHEIKWDFDSYADVSACPWKDRWGKGLTLSLETDKNNVYGGTGKSLKMAYKGNNGDWDSPRIWLNSSQARKADGIVFWVKSDKAGSIKVTMAENWSTLVEAVKPISAGENIVKIKYSDFKYTDRDDVPVLSSLIQINIAPLGNTEGTIWVDSIGYFTNSAGGGNLELPKGSIEKWGFDSAADVTGCGWSAVFAGTDNAGMKLSLENNSANVYSGAGKSLKMVYDGSKGQWNNSAGVRLGDVNTDSKGDGLVFWLKSDKNTTLTLGLTDKKDWATVVTADASVKAGENIVCVPYDNFKYSGSVAGKPDLSRIIQLTITPSGAGTMYLDAVGFYTDDKTEPEDPNIPTAAVIHDPGYSECNLTNSKWQNKTTVNTQIEYEASAGQYHSGTTNVPNNTGALKVSYSDLNSTGNVNFYYNDGIRVSSEKPYIFAENSILSFWVWSSQKVKLTVTYMDSDNDNKMIQCKEKTFLVEPGENIVKIPMSEMVPDGKQASYQWAYQIQLTVGASDISKKTGKLYFDSFGFYDASLKINEDPAYIADDSYIWWNFDQYETIDQLSNSWKKHWEGDTGEGVKLTIEETASNVYGGGGRSLKMVYDRSKGVWNSPGVWCEGKMGAYGDGITFWVKSREKTTLSVVCLDGKYRGIEVPPIPVEIGENIIILKYSDFKFSDANIDKNEKPDFSFITQLQLRMVGCNNGTMWLDTVGYSGLKNGNYNTYKFLNPPESYEAWQDGFKNTGDDFEKWPGDDDLAFCTDWYYESQGWIALEKNTGGNSSLRMDFNMTQKASVLYNITEFKEVDPYGGISFWAKTSENRMYSVELNIGGKSISTVIRGSTSGKYYKIPFSEFWLSNNIMTSYVPNSRDLVKVTAMTIHTNNSVNPPALNVSNKCSFWLDDICFVDSLSYKRAGSVDYYQNGVRLIAKDNAFNSGVSPKFDLISLSAADTVNYISQMINMEKIDKAVSLKAYNSMGVALIPSRSVELIFDIPSFVNPLNAVVYQSYIDGSVMKVPTTVGNDGKLHASVYKLGDYIVAYGNNSGADFAKTGDSALTTVAILLVSVSAAFVFAVLTRYRNTIIRKGGNK